jgi:hypothetical protein
MYVFYSAKVTSFIISPRTSKIPFSMSFVGLRLVSYSSRRKHMRITKNIAACCCVPEAWIYACQNCSLAIASTGRVEDVFQNFRQCAVAEWNLRLLWRLLQTNRLIGFCSTSIQSFHVERLLLFSQVYFMSRHYDSRYLVPLQILRCRPSTRFHSPKTLGSCSQLGYGKLDASFKIRRSFCAGFLSGIGFLFNKRKKLRRAVNENLFDPNQMSFAKKAFKDRGRRTRF